MSRNLPPNANVQPANDSVARFHNGTIILVKPQLGVNIGAAARAMLNCGFRALRLVQPRTGWSKKDACAMACSADFLVKDAKIFANSIEATRDMTYTIATTARGRNQRIHALNLDEGIARLVARQQQKTALLFGCESCGLDNDTIALCDAVIHIPLHPFFPSLNLAQAVLLTCYAWQNQLQPTGQALTKRQDNGGKKHLYALFHHVEQTLETTGFVRNPSRKAITFRRLRNLIIRAQPTAAEIRLLRGVITNLFHHHD